MTLRQKFWVIFTGLALLALVLAGVTLWLAWQWERTQEQLNLHYQRSLALQNVRAATFRAFKEVADAIAENDSGARQDFDNLLKPLELDFAHWSELASSDAEHQQVADVRAVYQQLLRSANAVFELGAAGQRSAATELMELELDDVGFTAFEDLTTQAIASDLKILDAFLVKSQSVQRTAQWIPIIAAFGILSLMLLLWAYLSSDLFAPLQRLAWAMRDAARGDFRQRLGDGPQADEIGAVNRGFDAMLETLAAREQLVENSVTGEFETHGLITEQTLETTPSRVLLHNLVARIRESLLQLEPNLAQDTSGGKEVPASVKPVMEHLELLSKALIRITEFGFPLDLNLASSDIPSLLHEIPFRFQDELARRAISFEITLAPEVGAAVVDRFKLREAIGALMRYALASLPERGGNLGLRSSIVLPDGTESKELLIEVADNGHGHDPQWFETMVDTSPSSEMEGAALSRTDLSLAKGIIERHGGRLQIRNVIGEGTFAQIALPLRE